MLQCKIRQYIRIVRIVAINNRFYIVVPGQISLAIPLPGASFLDLLLLKKSRMGNIYCIEKSTEEYSYAGVHALCGTPTSIDDSNTVGCKFH